MHMRQKKSLKAIDEPVSSSQKQTDLFSTSILVSPALMIKLRDVKIPMTLQYSQ